MIFTNASVIYAGWKASGKENGYSCSYALEDARVIAVFAGIEEPIEDLSPEAAKSVIVCDPLIP